MIINGKTYTLPELDFNAICRLEDMNISITTLDKHMLSTVRGFAALAMGGDLERAGREIEEHMKKGGALDGILEEIVKAINDSGFFQALGTKKPAPKGK